MPYTRTSGTKAGADAIAYNRDGIFDDYHGKQRDPDEPRYLLMSESNMLPDDISPYEEQMSVYWAHDTHKRHLTEIRRNIISFADDELPADDPRSAERALEIVKAFHEQEYPDRQIAYFVEGGDHKIHVHAHINDWRMSDGKCIDKQKTHARWLAKSFDEFADGYQFADGTTFSLTKENAKNLATLAMNKQDRPYRQSQYERAVADGNQSVINKNGLYNTVGEYIRDTIIQARDETRTYDDYLSYLQDNYITHVDNEYLLSQDAFDTAVKRPKSANLSKNPKIGEARLMKKYDLDASSEGIQAYMNEHRYDIPVEELQANYKPSEPVSAVPEKTYVVGNTELTQTEYDGFVDLMDEVGKEEEQSYPEPDPEPKSELDLRVDAFARHTTDRAADLAAMTIKNNIKIREGRTSDVHHISDIRAKLQVAAANGLTHTDTPDNTHSDEHVVTPKRHKHNGKAEAAAKAKAAREQAERAKKDEIAAKLAAEKDEREARDAKIASQIDMFDDAFGEVTAAQLKEAGKLAVSPDITHKSLGES